MIEMYSGMMCVCLPSLAKLVSGTFVKPENCHVKSVFGRRVLKIRDGAKYGDRLDDTASPSDSGWELRRSRRTEDSGPMDCELGTLTDRIYLTKD